MTVTWMNGDKGGWVNVITYLKQPEMLLMVVCNKNYLVNFVKTSFVKNLHNALADLKYHCEFLFKSVTF